MGDSEQLQAPAAAPPPATLGEMLRDARLAQDLTLEQLSTELRIEAKQLHALEANRFEEIGIPVFIKGYLKQYGIRLGLNVSDLLALYYKQTTLADVQVQPNRTIKLRDERQITSWAIAAIVLLVVVGGLAAWWWNGGSMGGASSTQAPAALSPSATDPADDSAPPAAPPPTPIQLPAVDPPAAPPADPGGQQAAPIEVPAVAAAALIEPVPENESDVAAPAVTIPLQFTFEQESWAEVTDARGERLLFGLNAAGRNVTVRGEPPFAVVLGDASGVRLTVDGMPYEIPTGGRQGSLARFAVDVVEE
jgi:cytoskeleton protein RodZ